MAADRSIPTAKPHFQQQPREFYGIERKQIGRGSFGRIYNTSRGYAVKVLLLKNGAIRRNILNEIVYPAALHHPSIIQYHDVYIFPEKVEIVMDQYEGDLEILFSNFNPLIGDPLIFRMIAHQMISALAELHSHNIIHRDIKPGNIFYRTCPNQGLQCVLGDFGIAIGWECWRKQSDMNVISLPYRPPEILVNSTYTSAADIWSLGCTLYRIFTGRTPFDGDNELYLLTRILNKLGPLTNTSSLYPSVVRMVEKQIGIEARLNRVSAADLPRLIPSKVLARLIDPSLTPPIQPLVSNPEINRFLLRMIQIDPRNRATAHELLLDPIIDRRSSFDSNELISSCYRIQPTPEISCMNRILPYNRPGIQIPSIPVDSAIELMMETVDRLQLPIGIYLAAIDFFYRGITIVPLLNPEVVALAILYITSEFRTEIIPENSEAPFGWEKLPSVEKFAAETRYSTFDLIPMINYMLEVIQWDLMATTNYDRLLAMSFSIRPSSMDILEDKLPMLEDAIGLLLTVAPIPNIYLNPNTVSYCWEWAKEKNLDWLKISLRSFYQNHPHLRKRIPAKIQRWID